MYTIKPNIHEKVWELQMIEFALPEDIERLRHSKKRDLGFAEKLELMDDAGRPAGWGRGDFPIGPELVENWP